MLSVFHTGHESGNHSEKKKEINSPAFNLNSILIHCTDTALRDTFATTKLAKLNFLIAACFVQY